MLCLLYCTEAKIGIALLESQPSDSLIYKINYTRQSTDYEPKKVLNQLIDIL